MARIVEKNPSLHIRNLRNFIDGDAPYSELFEYAKKYLPNLKREGTNVPDLGKLDGYVPEVVEYLDVVSELPSLPVHLKNLATELSIYANGASIETDSYYAHFDPSGEISKALKVTSDKETIS